MAKTRVPEEKIREILAEQTAGSAVSDIVKKHKISSATFYNWKSRFGGGSDKKAAEAPRRGRPKGASADGSGSRAAAPALSRAAPAASGASLAEENRRLKVMLVDLMLQVEHLKSQLGKR